MTSFEVSTVISASPERVFALFTDLAHAPDNIRAIKKLELLTPGPMCMGTRFRETRVMFGKEATEEMEVIELDPGRSYAVTASSCGTRYLTRFSFQPVPEGTRVDLRFEATPVSFFAKLMMRPMGALMAKAGWAVTKEYYVNDAGNQVVALGWAAYWRYLRAVTLDAEEWNAEQTERRFGVTLQYRGDYLVAVGEALAERYGDSLVARRIEADTLSIDHSDADMALLRPMLKDLLKLKRATPVESLEEALTTRDAGYASFTSLNPAGILEAWKAHLAAQQSPVT